MTFGRDSRRRPLHLSLKYVATTLLLCVGFLLHAQSVRELTDSTDERGKFTLNPIIPRDYDGLLKSPGPFDLRTPSNIRTEVEYDVATGLYTVRTFAGAWEAAAPLILTRKEYENWRARRAMTEYWKLKGQNQKEQRKERSPLNPLDMNFATGSLERIFGPGGLRLQTRGSVQIKTGIKSTLTDNPALAVGSKRKTYFDFDQRIQATVGAMLGTRLSFNLNYNTDATFDFDSKNLKLAYEGDEDDIIRSIEAGNVSMTTGSSLIRGSTSLFGIKTELQFGRLKATALVSQQNSESKRISSRGGVQTTAFTIPANEYDQNRHFFLAQWFRENYDEFAANLPLVGSGVKISRIEVWVTNKSNSFSQSRNLVAFQDLGENRVLANGYWTPDASYPFPSNMSNNLPTVIKEHYPEARWIARVTEALQPLSAYGIEGGSDYEKVESARLLSENEYTLNSTLGYISLNNALTSDEVLAVAFEYTLNGKVYQVGEFSTDVTSTDESLYVKMLRATTVSTSFPMWRLMMKNVYSVGAYSLEKNNFRMQVKYLSDTTGTQIVYLPVEGINDVTLLQLTGLDRIDSNNMSNPDGFFDYIEGYTVLSDKGKIIFPVAEPFGAHLEKVIDNRAIASKYVYRELYDSTKIAASQVPEKNKFYLTGEYRGNTGAQIRLNAINVPRGSVTVTAGGTVLVENVDYTVDYAMGIVTITNRSIIDSGENISVTLENQSLFSTQRKTLLGLDLQYSVNRNLNLGATVMHFSEKALTEKVNIGDETVSNTMLGLNLSYNNSFMWLTNLVDRIPTVNATAPSSIALTAEFAKLLPHSGRPGTAQGSSYIDDFEESQTGIDLRSPYSWHLASTPYDPSADALFPEAKLSNNVDYGKNRALLAWNYIDRMFTSKNSTLCPAYIKSDLKQLSNPYVREVSSREIFPGRDLTYGESSVIQTLNLSFYPEERGPYNLDADNIDENFRLLYPERRWGGIMRKMDNTNFEQSNIEYLQFWLMSPFLDPENPNYEGGDLYFNFGEISEDILKDGMKSYENGIPADGNDSFLTETVWGRVSKQMSLTYSFDNDGASRLVQDVGLDGLSNPDEFNFPSYENYLRQLRSKLPATTVSRLEGDMFSPFNDPAGDNYHFFRGSDYDQQRLSILERYKRYNGVEGNSLSAETSGEPLYQSSKNTPDVEDINMDNTLNEYERYFQYKVSIRKEDFVVGKNYITDKQVSMVHTRDGENVETEWYQFKIPLSDYEKVVGSIRDFTTIRFARIFLTGFKNVVHLRFGTLELVRGEWREYGYSLAAREDIPARGELDISVVNIEENASREPVNYVLPPDVSRVIDPGQSQIVQLNEQSLSLKVNLDADDTRGIYRNTQLDLRNYNRLQMWIHAEAPIDNSYLSGSDDLALIFRLGTDIKNNYYEYEIPLSLTPPGNYNNNLPADRAKVWPMSNFMNIRLQDLVETKTERNRKWNSEGGSNSYYSTVYSRPDPTDASRIIKVSGNPTLGDVRVMLVGIKNMTSVSRGGTVWINELKVTEFDDKGGWAAKANVNLNVSDVASFNVGVQHETSGFGNVDQGLNERRLDDMTQFSFAMQTDLGRFLPGSAKLRAPLYYSVSTEKYKPEYNPLDSDVPLAEAISSVESQAAKDSIMDFAIDRTVSKAFSLSGLNFGIRSDVPKPWDPANFTVNFSFNRQSMVNPAVEYENTSDYRGSFLYNYSPQPRGFKPLGRIKSRNANLRFLKEWEILYLPTNIGFITTISRYYYEQQARSANDASFSLPVSVSKNFLWDRQINLSWNLTRQLSFNFMSNTSARIEETVGAVNRKLFPDRYKEWKDTVWHSILRLGTPWAYNQTFNMAYRTPFNQIPVLDFISGTVSYASLYTWNRGTTVNGVSTGHTAASQGAWNVDSRLNMEGLYNKWSYAQRVNRRFAPTRRREERKRGKRVERTYTVRPDSTVNVRHNLRTKNVRVIAQTIEGNQVKVATDIKDENTILLTYKHTNAADTTSFPLKIIVNEIKKEERNLWKDIGDYSLRTIMSVRNVAFRWRSSRSLSLPLFANEIGDWFGQSISYGPMSPGLGFAFGFPDRDFIATAKSRGWLITDNGQTSPALWSRVTEANLEINLEPIKGLRITLVSNRTHNRTDQVQFMFDGMPTMTGGSYSKTHWALSSALRGSTERNGYHSGAFERFIEYIPRIKERVLAQYEGLRYPSTGFMEGSHLAGMTFNADNGDIPQTGSDILIPAFLAAYSGISPRQIYLSPFPSFAKALPNWRVSYDGLTSIGAINGIFKSLMLTHAYQCTYSVASFSSFMNWQRASGTTGDLGFIPDDANGNPIPSSPFNIASVAITERFAPLIGVVATLNNDITVSAEWRDQRTLTLNSGAVQLIEATTRGLTVGAGYRIVAFNTFLKLKGSQTGVSNDLTLNAELSLQNTKALIRRIETAYTQPTSGTRTLNINFTANYILSKRFTIGAYFDHQINTPLVTAYAYPTINTSYGVMINLSLAR